MLTRKKLAKKAFKAGRKYALTADDGIKKRTPFKKWWKLYSLGKLNSNGSKKKK